MEPIPRDPSDDDVKRQEMIAALTNGIESEDYAFVTEVAASQDLLRPFEIVEFMDVKRRNTEDPVEERRWGDGLEHYLISLDGHEFPQEEADAINSVIERFKFDRVVSNEEIAKEPEVRDVQRDEELDWKHDYFEPLDINVDTLNRLGETPIGQSVVSDAKLAVSRGDPSYLGNARNTLSQFQFGSSEKLHKLLDVYVYLFANQRVELAVSRNDHTYIDDAMSAVREFASSEETVIAMKRSLDKMVFQYAKVNIGLATSRRDNSYIQEAIDALNQYGSSEARITAMLEELGLA